MKSHDPSEWIVNKFNNLVIRLEVKPHDKCVVVDKSIFVVSHNQQLVTASSFREPVLVSLVLC